MFAAVLMLGGNLAAFAASKRTDAPLEPKLLSVYPFTGQRGTTFTAVLRGTGLREATSIFVKDAPLTVAIEAVETELSEDPLPSAKPRTPVDLIRLQIRIEAAAKAGQYSIRLITPRGISNAIPVSVFDMPVADEPATSHETPETAVAIDKLPAAMNGRISRRGETDYYVFHVAANETVTFEVISGLPSTGATGGNANGFDPAIAIYEQSGSWFDPKRVNRIAFNDEPLWVIGKGTDAYLVHRFAKTGDYLVRIEAFSGQGGPDYGYQLRILAGDIPQDEARVATNWEERKYDRRLSSDRMNELAERGGKAKEQAKIETYRTAIAPTLFRLPGTLEGSITHPGEAQRSRFHLEGPQDIAIEIETPAAPPPQFNPIVRLLNAAGEEVATNVFAGRGLCTGELNKSLQAKVMVPLRDAGDYTVEVRDTTSDLADAAFRYRVLVRPQIAHLGDIKIEEDRVNVTPGDAKSVRVVFDREEDYRGAVAVTAESLPPGVEALAGADFEPEKDAPLHPGKRERYTPRTERLVVVFTAAADTIISKQPHLVRLVVRPIVDGKPGAIVGMKEIPLMVVAKP